MRTAPHNIVLLGMFGLLSGCYLRESFVVRTNLPATACPALRAAAQEIGWHVVESRACASVELGPQGRLIFDEPEGGEVKVSMRPPDREVLMNEIVRLRVLMKQDATRIVVQAEQAIGIAPPEGVWLRVD